MSNVVTERFVEDGFGLLNARQLDQFFGLYASELRNPGLPTLGLPATKDGFRTLVGAFYQSFSDARFVPQKICCAGDTAMFRWVFRGRHTGPFQGIPATGKTVEVNAFTSFRVGPSGTIIEQHDHADVPTLLRQLGVMP
jgi:steroid delta-isomerase-like uncharacterized protein